MSASRTPPGSGALPESLQQLLHASSSDEPAAWEAFAHDYSFLLLHVARALAQDRDERMDLYARILEVLHADDCQRLRGYAAQPETKFTTWLVVVARRICVDFHRSRFGRKRSGESDARAEQRFTRRALEELVPAPDDPASLPADDSLQPDAALRSAELSRALVGAVTTLDPADQLLLRLRFDDGLSAAEIATLLRFPSQFHVYRRLKVVLGQLKTELAARGVEDAAS